MNTNPAAKSEGITAKPSRPVPPIAKERPKLSGAAITGVACVAGGLLLLFCCLPVGLGMVWTFSKSKPAGGDPGPEPVPVAQAKENPEKQPGKGKAKAPPALPPKIREAVDKGSAHLKKQLLEGGGPLLKDPRHPGDGPVGAKALAGLALLEAKVPPDDPAVQQALADVRAGGPRLQLVYSLCVAIFFLNRLHDAAPLEDADRKLLRTFALRLVNGQLPDGYWTYLNPPITGPAEEKLLDQLRANSYKPGKNFRFGPSTHSMTQFALLALWGSRRHDLPIRPSLLAATTRFNQTQYADGTWGYVTNKNPNNVLHDSNTCAGLIALAMDKTLREDREFKNLIANDPPADPRADEQRDLAFAHLGKVIGRTKDDPIRPSRHPIGKVFKADAWGDYYFLWCIERVAVIYDMKMIGGKDWYDWGSRVILENQRPDGSWQDTHGDVPDTCFAVLFLTRANLAKDLTESIRTRGGKEAIP